MKKQVKDKELLKHDSYCPDCECWFVADGKGEVKLKYCKDCGQELIMPARCIFCGNLITAPSKFCSGCGELAIH